MASLRNPLRFLFALTLVVAAPFLGLCSRAQAGYIAPLSLASQPTTNLFTTGVAQPDADDAASAAAPAEPNSDIDRRPDDRKDPQALQYALPPARPDASGFSTGAGSQTVPTNAGTGAASQPPATATRPQTDAPVLVGVLFLETVERRPPLFPSRLFRPPRLS